MITPDESAATQSENSGLLPKNWAELAPLVDAILDAPTARRAAMLAELTAGDPERRAALERLVADCGLDENFLNRPAAERFAHLVGEPTDTPLTGTVGGRYRIEREIGRGGMARVYLAHDIKHAREVAVKVIRAELAASLGRERFLREIAIAARLRHPNIVPLYDSGDADGVLYFVMPYEEGQSLRQRLSDGSLSIAESMSVLRDVARALAYAHEHGVVHRDVKPDNVMLSGGATVVTDFGIAKAVSAAHAGASASTLTQLGAGIGTPAYMSPEQAVGDPSTDHRADIYSFGCLAYELYTGKPPFHGMPAHQIIAAHVGTIPVPLHELSATVPDSVVRLVARCLEKNPDARPQTARELVAQLEGAQSGTHEATARAPQRSRRLVGALAVAGAVVLGGGSLLFARDRSARLAGNPTVAVMPLTSGADSVQSELADGLSDEIGIALFKESGVRVISRLGVSKYRGQRDLNLAKIGRELGARFLVTGSLHEVGDRLKVLATLVDATDGSMVWSDLYDHGRNDLSLVRDEIARSVGDALRKKFGTSGKTAPVARRSTHVPSPEAYRLYVLAQRALTRRGQSIRSSIEMFRRATEIDTLYADAFSGLSFALALSRYFQVVSVPAVAEEATRMAHRALALDPTLAQPHLALGNLFQNTNDWEPASNEFRTALRLRSPDDVEPLIQFGRHLVHRGFVAEGLKQLLLARVADPASAVVSSWVSYAYYLDGQLDSALAENQRAFQNDSMNLTTLNFGALVRLKAGRTADARDFANRRGATALNPTGLYVLEKMGDTAAARRSLHEFEAQQPRPVLLETIRAYMMIARGDTSEALASLERASAAKEMWPTGLAFRDPILDPIRASARFQTLLRSVGLDPTVPAAVSPKPR
jgi:serine/threonine-protein kinase